jgi:hypothetical protein
MTALIANTVKTHKKSTLNLLLLIYLNTVNNTPKIHPVTHVFEKLGVIKKAGSISLHSSAIATYAICGFANPSSMGILIGILSAMTPEKRATITSVAFRAFFSGCFALLQLVLQVY